MCLLCKSQRFNGAVEMLNSVCGGHIHGDFDISPPNLSVYGEHL
nr:MAG TPA: hypothetical protein [Caudoviricetes sp.]